MCSMKVNSIKWLKKFSIKQRFYVYIYLTFDICIMETIHKILSWNRICYLFLFYVTLAKNSWSYSGSDTYASDMIWFLLGPRFA